jgi:aldose 1-epimerase
VSDFWISNGVFTARIATTGAALADVGRAGVPHGLVLGLPDIVAYRANDQLFGAVIGRVANRTVTGAVALDGVALPLAANGGPYHLHGGAGGFATRRFELERLEADCLSLAYASADGEEGYPGALAVLATYEVLPPATLRLTFEATTTRPTLVNLAHHAYLNLNGAGPVADHSLVIAADHYLPGDEDFVPTGDVASVAGTPFDWRAPRPVETAAARGFDLNHTFCLARGTRAEPAFAARLEVAGRPSLEVWTTQPGLHLYDAYKLRPGTPGLDGTWIGPGDGLCLEAQGWPNAANRLDFPSIRLDPGEHYRQVTEYRFTPARPGDR